MSLIQYLASSNYITVNKSLIKAFGLREAVLLGELCSEYTFWEQNNKLEDGFFYATIEKIEENTGLSAYEQRAAIKTLEEAGVLVTKLKGLPAKKYFSICETKLLNFSQLDVKKLHSSNTNINNNIDKNDNTIVLSSDKPKENDTEDFFNTTPLIDKPKKKRGTLYSNCMALIDEFTIEEDVKNLLRDYLKIRLERKDIPFGKASFNGMLKKLRTLTTSKAECLKIIQQSIDRNYPTFYPLNKPRYSRGCPELIEQSNNVSITTDELEEALEIGEKF